MINLADLVPLSIFLLIFFMAFSFLETVIIFIINKLIRIHWKVVVDRLLKMIVHHRNLVRLAAVGSLAIVFALLVWLTPILDILVGGTDVLQILAVVLAIELFVVYFVTTHETKVTIEKRIRLWVFSFFSMMAFTGIMYAADIGYTAYEASIKAAIVEPVVESIEEEYEAEVESRLMEVFRQQVKDDECERYDYADKTGAGITQFVFVSEDPFLADAEIDPQDIRETGEPLVGKRCVHETTFMLTPQGKWYQVVEQSFE